MNYYNSNTYKAKQLACAAASSVIATALCALGLVILSAIAFFFLIFAAILVAGLVIFAIGYFVYMQWLDLYNNFYDSFDRRFL